MIHARLKACYGYDLSKCLPSGLRRKNSEQRENKVDHQKRDHVVMGLRTAGRSNGSRIQCQAGSDVTVYCASARLPPYTSAGTLLVARARIALRHMTMRGNLTGGQGHRLYPSALPQRETLTHMDGNATLQI